jgi:hypothetical protein
MSGRMNWRRAQLHGKPYLDVRRELEFEDRASKWLRTVEQRRERREGRQPRITITALSSSVPTLASSF